MNDAKKRNNAAQVEGISAFKTRQKVNKMFLARTIKVNSSMVYSSIELLFKFY